MEERLNQPLRISGTKLIVGLFFAVAGLLMTADNLDLLDAERYLRYWPVVLLAVGLIKLADPGRRLLGVILTVVGASLLARFAGWVPITIFDLWPLLLILAGIGMVLRAVGVRGSAEPRDTRHIVAVLSTRKVTNTSRDFTGARIASFMGGCELDLTQADIANGPAVIETFAMMSGIEIIVPDDWEVIGEVLPVMGGFEIKTAPTAPAPTRQLIVRGTSIMAGIEVKRRTR